ncbi:MAG: hypothetical protein IJ493_11525 [Clostridia bacterium]|nr:hypothetical protein [Clostridia bacterium]
MQRKKNRLDAVMLAATLFAVSGAVLIYNLRTMESGEIAVSLSDLMESGTAVSASAVSDMAAANIEALDAVAVAAEPVEAPVPVRSYELLEPIVRAPGN